MSTNYYSVVTKKGRALEATSKATGTPINFTHLAVGDGGGAPISPSAEMEGLLQERWRGELNDLYIDPDNPDVVIAEAVIRDEVGGFTVREAGLYTDSGVFYAVGSVAATEKPLLSQGSAKSLYLRFYVEVSSEATVNLLIDPAKVLATRQWTTVEINKSIATHNVDPLSHEDIRNAIANIDLSGLVPKTRVIHTIHPLTGGGELTGDLTLALDKTAAREGDILVFRKGNWVAASPHVLCKKFYYERHPELETGFEPAYGGILPDASVKYPDAWEYLLSEAGQLLCLSEAEWLAMNTAVWHTNADGTKIGWDGIGGVPFYSLNLDTGALRLPDIRGMYVEAAGFDALDVGGVHGDGMRLLVGSFHRASNTELGIGEATGCLYVGGGTQNIQTGTAGPNRPYNAVYLDSSRVVPASNKVQPRAWGALPCVYLGAPK